MLRAAVLTATLLACYVPVALAYSGNGPYDPHQVAPAATAANPYYASLQVNVTDAQLLTGKFSRGLRAARADGNGGGEADTPSARAGDLSPALDIPLLAVVVALGLVAAAITRARAPALR